MDYLIVKTLHQSAVTLSVAGFFARRTVPHVVDTVLLGSALLMAWMLGLNPLTTPWLLAKIIGLLLYIGLGMLALRPGRATSLRALAWVAALLVFGWIVSVAISKSPLGVFSLVL